MNKASILLVDDETRFVENLSKLLMRRGYFVTKAHDGLSAIRTLEQRDDLDVILLDLQMPGINGIETLREIKAKWPEIEVIILTAYGDVQSAVQAAGLEAYDFWGKPVELDGLIERINQAFRKKTLSAERLFKRRVPDPAS